MKTFTNEIGGRVIIIRLDRGDKVLESVKKAIKEQNIENAAIVCGYGSMDHCHMHWLATTSETYPAENEYMSWDHKPVELCSMSGVIADGEPHIHAVASTGGKTVGGHLETECTAGYCLEIVIYEHSGIKLARKPTGWGPDALEEI
ncbi:MAG TPA: DNA-binding protein [Lachnospiraceae bacterium]|nr:DNA-binding protein [Lachnospiraceae bacterium]